MKPFVNEPIKLSPDAIVVMDKLLHDKLTEGQTAANLRKIKNLPPQERTLFWEGLRVVMPQLDYEILHRRYIEGCLGHRWS